MIQAIRDYENQANEEARFVYALDKVMPVILNIVNEGHGWQKHKISFEQMHATKKDKVKAHPEIHDYYLQIHDLLSQNPHLFSGKTALTSHKRRAQRLFKRFG
jgi:beta-galactosidase beta subunit